MGKYFGTDGFRGEAGKELTAEHAYKIGRFLGGYFKENGKKVRAVIGKDTRRSSYMLEYAVASGLVASGADAYMLHVTTTPSVSYVVAAEDFGVGIMISASHNPFYDNGIKIVNSKGEKIEQDIIYKIECYLDGEYEKIGMEGDFPLASGSEIGEIIDYSAGRNRYIGYLISLSKNSFKGYKIGLDCANGGGWMIAKSVFDALGAKTYAINASPDGFNINHRSGSTHIEELCRFVRLNNMDMGFAFDGDADRCIAVDQEGEEVNGDKILYVLANEMKSHNELADSTVVTTVMSNMGLYRALKDVGISYEQTKVGDKYVYECMSKNGYGLGGEQSGHIIISKYATTGDGILTAIKIAEAVIESKQSLSKLCAPVVMLPQVTKNIRVKSKEAVLGNERVQKELEKIKRELGEGGRILLRPSGTEPLIRIMAEAEQNKVCNEYIDRVIDAMKGEGLC